MQGVKNKKTNDEHIDVTHKKDKTGLYSYLVWKSFNIHRLVCYC